MISAYIETAVNGYSVAIAELERYTRDHTALCVQINDGGYPMTYTFTPQEDAWQSSMFDADDGISGEMTVICSSTGIGVDMGLKCHVQADVLKKLLKQCQICADACLHAEKAARADK